MKASRCIKEAADVLAESPASIQLRYLQTLHSISEEQNHTVVLPIPTGLLANLGVGGGLQPVVPKSKPSTQLVSPRDQSQTEDSGQQQSVSDNLIDLGTGNTKF